MPPLRRSEWILIVYFTFTAVLALVLPLPAPVRNVSLGVNALVITGVLLLAASASLSSRLLGIMRDWYAIPMMLLGYRQMGWFAPTAHTFELELRWVEWDRWLLRESGLKQLIELAGPLLPGLLEISYSLVYAISTFSLAMFYVHHRRERVDAFLTIALLGVFCSYALFPLFPSEPPRTVFPNEDFPAHNTVFRQFNWWLLSGYGIHTSVFPSAHVSGAFSCGLALLLFLPERRGVGRAILVLASVIAVSTVYGRYHYAVDALAGFAVALLAALAGWGLTRRERTEH